MRRLSYQPNGKGLLKKDAEEFNISNWIALGEESDELILVPREKQSLLLPMSYGLNSARGVWQTSRQIDSATRRHGMRPEYSEDDAVREDLLVVGTQIVEGL